MKSAHRPRQSRPAIPAMEWIEESTGLIARVTVVGSRSVLVENCAAIARFDDGCVRLETPRGQLCIHGGGLSLCEVRPGALIVRGEVRSIELPCPGGEHPHEG